MYLTYNYMSWLVTCRNGALGSVSSWKLKECIAAHQLLGTVLVDPDAAFSKYYKFSWIVLCHCSA